MLIHYVKVTLRNFHRHRTSFFINYTGLVAGLVTILFIFVWVTHELSVDTFHENNDQIYRLASGAGGSTYLLNTSPRFSEELESAIPEIEYIVNSAWGALESSLQAEETVFSTVGEFGSKEFFNLFTYPLIRGDKNSVLDPPDAIVLSESMAMKLFQSTDVIGEQLTWRWFSVEENVTVTGVYKDPPVNSSIQFDYVLSFKVYEKRFSRQLERGRNGRTYLKIAEGADPEIINQKIRTYTREAYPDYEGEPYFIMKYSDYYLQDVYEKTTPVGGRIELVRLFMVIGVLILVIACVNFMNLSTARAALRTKEIGVRKTMGALRKSLVIQFLTESCIMSMAAGVTAIVLMLLLFPFFENLTGQKINLQPDAGLLLSILGIVLITGLLSGSYPALYLSRFQPLKVLKGIATDKAGDQWLRKRLVTFQFCSSLTLIVAVLVIYQQMKFIQNKEPGYRKEAILNFQTTGMNGEKQQSFLSEVRQLAGVKKASGISHALFGAKRSGANITWAGKNPEQEVWFEWGYVGYDMLELVEVKLEEGRFFSQEFGDEESKVVINKTTQRIMGAENPVGKKLTVGESEYEIIGVTEDFHYQSLHELIRPTFFLLNSRWTMKLAVRIDENRMSETIEDIEQLYTKFNPGFPFEYTFHDQDRQNLYATEEKVSVLSRYAAGLAILISSLGLFGLVSFVAERKAKELSIRKVLGASARALFGSLSREFILPISLASVLGIAASSFLLNEWLQRFAYRVEMSWWIFIVAVFMMLAIALATSISQILKAIWANPVSALRDE